MATEPLIEVPIDARQFITPGSNLFLRESRQDGVSRFWQQTVDGSKIFMRPGPRNSLVPSNFGEISKAAAEAQARNRWVDYHHFAFMPGTLEAMGIKLVVQEEPVLNWWERIIRFDDDGTLHIGPEIIAVSKLQTWLEDHIYGEDASTAAKVAFYTVLFSAGAWVTLKKLGILDHRKVVWIYEDASKLPQLRNVVADTTSKQWTDYVKATNVLEMTASWSDPLWQRVVSGIGAPFLKAWYALVPTPAAAKTEFVRTKIAEPYVMGVAEKILGENELLKNVVMRKLMAIFGAKTPMGVMNRILATIVGVDILAAWLASDNIVTGTGFPLLRLKPMVEAGTITKAQALEDIDTLQEWKDKATNFIDWSTVLNPALWLFKPIFQANTQLAQLNLDQAKANIEGLPDKPGPITPPGEPRDDDEPVDDRPTQNNAFLNVLSKPQGAQIYLDGVYTFNRTNFSILRKAGTYIVQLSAPSGFRNPGPRTVTLEGGVNQDVDFGDLIPLGEGDPPDPGPDPPELDPPAVDPEPDTPPVATQAWVTLTSGPGNAKIYVDGTFKFVNTPFALLLDEGVHNVQLTLDGYKNVFDNILVRGGENIVRSYSMIKLWPDEPQDPFIPVPIDIELLPIEEKEIVPTAWRTTITARNAITGEILSGKIIINSIFTGKYTTNFVDLEPNESFTLRLEAFGFEPGETTITTGILPGG